MIPVCALVFGFWHRSCRLSLLVYAHGRVSYHRRLHTRASAFRHPPIPRGFYEAKNILMVAAMEKARLVVPLKGNHEEMNLLGDFHDVQPCETPFDETSFLAGNPSCITTSEGIKDRNHLIKELNAMTGFAAWDEVRLVTVPFNNEKVVIAHGGITTELLERFKTVDAINTFQKEKFEALAKKPKNSNPPKPLEEVYKEMSDPAQGFNWGDQGPTWTRHYAEVWPSPKRGKRTVVVNRCESLDKLLKKLEATRLIVAHTTQTQILTKCDDTLIMIDVAASRGMFEVSFEKQIKDYPTLKKWCEFRNNKAMDRLEILKVGEMFLLFLLYLRKRIFLIRSRY